MGKKEITPESVADHLISEYRKMRAQGNNAVEALDELTRMILETGMSRPYAEALALLAAGEGEKQ